jgi:hypothetical protein
METPSLARSAPNISKASQENEFQYEFFAAGKSSLKRKCHPTAANEVILNEEIS